MLFYPILNKDFENVVWFFWGSISFPRYRVKLGDIFRIHGDKESLERLQSDEWVKKYPKNFHISEIKHVPKDVKFRVISRIQQSMSQSKLRRLIKRAEEGKGGIKEDDIKKYKIKMLQGGLDNPFVELISGSSKQRYRLFVALGELQDSEVKGEFDTFGLSKTATVPWF